jgi:hypothetical protein
MVLVASSLAMAAVGSLKERLSGASVVSVSLKENCQRSEVPEAVERTGA